MDPTPSTIELQTGIITVPEQTKKLAEKTGYLIKRGGKWKNWKRRYFVLKDNFLYYFEKPEDSLPKGVIHLDSCKVEQAEKLSKRKFCFSFTTKKSFTKNLAWNNRTYFLQAESEADMSSWMKALAKAVPGKKVPHVGKVTDDASKIFRACDKGDLPTVKTFLETTKFDLNSLDEEGNSLLHWAAVGGHVDIVKLLIEKGADVELKSRDGFTPMHSVAQEDRVKVLEILVEKGAKLDVPNLDDNNNTTLHYAACWGASKCTKLLIEKGASIDARALDKSTPLCFAAEKGHETIARLLIEANADIEAKNDPEEKGGATPLLLAAHNGQIEIVKLLIDKKANVKEKTIDGLNALHLAIRSGSDNADLVKILLNAGADMNGKTNADDTPLHYAAFMGYELCAKVLLEKGADVEARGQNYSTPLHFAAREGKLNIVKAFLDCGATPDSKDRDGDTALQCAELNAHVKCAELLRNALQAKK